MKPFESWCQFLKRKTWGEIVLNASSYHLHNETLISRMTFSHFTHLAHRQREDSYTVLQGLKYLIAKMQNSMLNHNSKSRTTTPKYGCLFLIKTPTTHRYTNSYELLTIIQILIMAIHHCTNQYEAFIIQISKTLFILSKAFRQYDDIHKTKQQKAVGICYKTVK